MASPQIDKIEQFTPEFAASGSRLLFDNKAWREWEIAAVEALQEVLGQEARSVDKSELLRFLHLAISYRNGGYSGTDYTEEDITAAKDLFLESNSYLQSSRPTWTSEIRDTLKSSVFMQGRDNRGRPTAVIRPLVSNREAWLVHPENLNTCIYALADTRFREDYLPGVAEQGVWIIDLKAVRLIDIFKLLPFLKTLIDSLTLNFPCRAGNFFVVNAGYALSAAVNTVVGFAQAEIREKVQVFSGDMGECAKEYFDLATLPVEYGGQGVMGCFEEVGESGGESGQSEPEEVPDDWLAWSGRNSISILAWPGHESFRGVFDDLWKSMTSPRSSSEAVPDKPESEHDLWKSTTSSGKSSEDVPDKPESELESTTWWPEPTRFTLMTNSSVSSEAEQDKPESKFESTTWWPEPMRFTGITLMTNSSVSSEAMRDKPESELDSATWWSEPIKFTLIDDLNSMMNRNNDSLHEWWMKQVQQLEWSPQSQEEPAEGIEDDPKASSETTSLDKTVHSFPSSNSQRNLQSAGGCFDFGPLLHSPKK